jgi:hypothetical protein
MKNSKLLNLQSNASNQDNSNSSKEVEHENVTRYRTVENTPFAIVLQNDKWRIVMGLHIVSIMEFDTQEQAIKYINKKEWELLFNACAAYIQVIEEVKQNQLKSE